MTKDNSTGKNKDFYDLGKKMFDRLNLPGTPKPYFLNREWVGLTEWEREAIAHSCGAMSADWLVFIEATEKALKEKNT